MTTLHLNEAQTKAYIGIKKFLSNKKQNRYLLLGPAGSGKTTVIVNAFNDSNLKIAFCAFTNKATQVLKKIADRFDVNFKSDFMTVHKLLMLEPKYLDKETEVSFKFDKNKIEHLKDYNVIIFDECSTIAKELYQYICEADRYMKFAHEHTLKYIFLGDYWQLAPVGEDKSIIFETAIKEKWLVSKLEKVMRSSNKGMEKINKNLIAWISQFKSGQVENFVKEYPYNLLPKKSENYLDLNSFLEQYMTTWNTVSPDVVILTYSRANCDKTNQAIQDLVDIASDRELPDNRDIIKFYPGDRCCLDRPVEVHRIKEVKKSNIIKNFGVNDLINITKEFDNLSHDEKVDNFAHIRSKVTDGIKNLVASLKESGDKEVLHHVENFIKEHNMLEKNTSNISTSIYDILDESDNIEPEQAELEPTTEIVGVVPTAPIAEEKSTVQQPVISQKRTVFLDVSTGDTLYNGEIFDILEVEDVHIRTMLNKFSYMKKTFEGQVLKIRKINDDTRTYEILHIPEPYINDARKLIKSHERHHLYLMLMNEFIKKFPKLDYGYCITIYKSQGSEWHTVLVNLNSIKWSIIGKGSIADIKKKMALFKSTYTAMSRASTKLYCSWAR